MNRSIKHLIILIKFILLSYNAIIITTTRIIILATLELTITNTPLYITTIITSATLWIHSLVFNKYVTLVHHQCKSALIQTIQSNITSKSKSISLKCDPFLWIMITYSMIITITTVSLSNPRKQTL